MSDESELTPLLAEDEYRRYAGTCRHCGFRGVWRASERDKSSYQQFYLYVKANLYPSFICFCEGCENQAVFDLTALSRD